MIVVHEPVKPFYKKIIAALSFTAGIAIAFYLLISGFSLELNYIKAQIHMLTIASLFFGAAFFTAATQGVEIDTNKNRYRKTWSISWFLFGQWKELMNIKYVSFFPQPLKDGAYIFEVNLWYEKNKHFCVFEHKDKGVALDFGIELAKELNSKLLNATQRGNYTWVDLTKV